MREYEGLVKDALAKGLRTTAKNKRNEQALIKADGMIPEDGTLRAVDALSLLTDITTLGEAFPYPQVFVGEDHTIVAGATKIWEYTSGTSELVLSGLTEGPMWTMADFHDYLVMANGQQIIRRNTTSHTWEVVVDETMPISHCVAGINGQLFVGSPEDY